MAYCRLGKVASSTWLRILNTAVGDPNPNIRQSKLFRPIFHFRQRHRRYFRFMFVRHPFDRLVSAYRDKFAGNRTEYWTEVARSCTAMNAITFAVVLRILAFCIVV